MSELLDDDGYPTDETLTKIEMWDYKDFRGLMKFVRSIWQYAECGYWRQSRRIYSISTGGWSGNEDIMAALQRNRMFWACCWKQSKRGGHYKFELEKTNYSA